MNNTVEIPTATVNAAILAVASYTNMSAPERAKLISTLLKGRTFKATYMKAKPDLDENGNIIPREAICTTNYDELAQHSSAYKSWLAEQEWKASKGLTSNRKQPHEYGNVQYWDIDKDSFRNFKVDNLISLEIIE